MTSPRICPVQDSPSFAGTPCILATLRVMSSPSCPSPRVMACLNSPASYRKAMEMPSSFSVTNSSCALTLAIHFCNSAGVLTLFRDPIGIS